MLSRLDDSARRQRQFVADASHELKSPLAELRAMIDVGERHPDSLADARLAGDVRFEVERMQRLVDDLLIDTSGFASEKIWIALRHHDGTVEQSVSDDGPGIPREEWGRVFDRFVRLDESRSRIGGGSGLGLAVAHLIARIPRGDLVGFF